MIQRTVESSVITFLAAFPSLFRQRADSLEEFNSVLQNDYTTLVEDSLLGLDYLPGIMEKMQLLLAGQTLTAISLLTGVPEVDVIGTLDKISTKRSALDAAVRTGSALGALAIGESSRPGRFALPSYDNLALAVGESSRRKVARESRDDKSKERTGVALQSDFAKRLSEQESLSSGKQFSVTFERNGNKLEVPMRVRLEVSSTDTGSIENIILLGEENRSLWERWIRRSTGKNGGSSAVDKIRATKDIAFSNDLIDEYRKNRFRDKSGYYSKMMEKRNGNWLSGMLTLSPSINNASALMIVSQETIDGLEARLGGDFDDFNVRKRVFENTLTMYYVVVDQTWGRVTIYTRGQNGSQQLDKNDFSKAKAGSADVNKIIEAYRSGAQPVL
ncbi:putative virion structural protein [Erwinia phage Wellington]|uniref:Putative virion structural protein n=2 Tax=Wellingtonvirus wellington TaxID=2734153 RepID=A0A1B2IDQ5_9CAUD|nr:putative virion structural protein [Erwinia phage vB_EamM_Kwan]YP_009806548.1 putative virion structural protein [Erwinia phage Wellington]ANZ49416.1 putative virion structural protein [Erwinia phage vB_EamM_Kwan]AXF51194.1 putative virion structural protein [Erwinia phage Wellington]